MKTTLNLIRANSPCTEGWKTLIKSLPTGFDPDQEFSLTHIVESNGLHDAVWCLVATTTDSISISQQLAIACAEHVLPIFETAHPDDKRPRLAIQAARDYLAGDISLDELNYTARAARAAANNARAAAHAAAAAALNVATYTPHASDAANAAINAAINAADATSTADITKIFLDMLKQTD